MSQDAVAYAEIPKVGGESMLSKRASPLLLELPSMQNIHSPLQGSNNRIRGKGTKKARRYNPYEKLCTGSLSLDESNLLETQVVEVEDLAGRALVASPNKPPGYK